MTNILEPDPENLNQAEEEELTYRLLEAMHEYEPGPDGKCVAETVKYCHEHHKSDYCQPCGLGERSVLHYYDDMHDHGGKDQHTKIVKHPPHEEGSRFHVISWSNLGRHCSEPNCEINVKSKYGEDIARSLGG